MAARIIRISPLAEQDLAAIRTYTIRTHGPEQAGRYLAVLDAAFNGFREFPEVGHRVSVGGGSVREFPVQFHVVRYEIRDDGIYILRIFHQRARRD